MPISANITLRLLIELTSVKHREVQMMNLPAIVVYRLTLLGFGCFEEGYRCTDTSTFQCAQ